MGANPSNDRAGVKVSLRLPGALGSVACQGGLQAHSSPPDASDQSFRLI